MDIFLKGVFIKKKDLNCPPFFVLCWLTKFLLEYHLWTVRNEILWIFYRLFCLCNHNASTEKYVLIVKTFYCHGEGCAETIHTLREIMVKMKLIIVCQLWTNSRKPLQQDVKTPTHQQSSHRSLFNQEMVFECCSMTSLCQDHRCWRYYWAHCTE